MWRNISCISMQIARPYFNSGSSKCKVYLPFCKKLSTSCFYYSEDEPKKNKELQERIKEMYSDFDIYNKDKPNCDNLNQLKNINKNLYDITIENEAITSDYSPDIIYDYDEERILKERGLWQDVLKKKKKIKEKNYERGETGVFDLKEIVTLLREQNAKNIVVISVPSEYRFVDYLVIATGRSARHITVVAELIKKVYKMKKHEKDRFITIEGKGSDWVALDMLTIAVHILTEEVRAEKDMEMLWCVGSEYDDKSQNIDDSCCVTQEN